ncbi:PRC-barrel domain containing protein [Aerophototrophica crusticola]|uniref:PRC-barrel domain containing protein n=1 Tax=Aerophototrophica crusticola TaxID=1709002 RepID=A0A858R3U4_9PROT|nr:PRC-barrel domain containing protein [Rhodospirillaceae bacterium B3]
MRRALSLLLPVLLAAPAWAEPNLKMGAGNAALEGGLSSAESLLGRSVETSDGRLAGRVTDVLFDLQARRAAIVVAGDGPAGPLAKASAVPWEEVQLQEDRTVLRIPHTTDQFVALPEYKDPEIGNETLKEDRPKEGPKDLSQTPSR